MIMAVVYLGLFGLLFLIECYLKKDIEELNVTRRELLVVVIVAAAVFGMSNLSYLDQNGLFSGRFAMDIFIIRTLVDLSGMAVLYAYHIQVKEMQLRLEKDALRNIMEMQYKNYQLSRESIDVVNQKYHDLKHQINLLKTQAYVGKSTSYLEKMEREIRVYETQNKTGNQECKTFQTTFHNTVPPLFCYLKLPQSPSVTAPSEREPCRQMQGNASLPEGGGCTVGADRGSYFFLKMISLLNT